MADKIKFKPIGDRVLVKPDEPETKTKSGIILTENSVEKPKSGIVLALGTGIMSDGKEYKFTVKEGARVYWGYGGNEMEIDGEKYLVISEGQLLGYDEE
ncbi:MAG: 10 kDa chaperonin [Candidatus Dojkabacteria bacterium]|nr:MAG: 10 kDa chaperonin [Candidatus Dojkabacteria bacterium]